MIQCYLNKLICLRCRYKKENSSNFLLHRNVETHFCIRYSRWTVTYKLLYEHLGNFMFMLILEFKYIFIFFSKLIKIYSSLHFILSYKYKHTSIKRRWILIDVIFTFTCSFNKFMNCVLKTWYPFFYNEIILIFNMSGVQ